MPPWRDGPSPPSATRRRATDGRGRERGGRRGRNRCWTTSCRPSSSRRWIAIATRSPPGARTRRPTARRRRRAPRAARRASSGAPAASGRPPPRLRRPPSSLAPASGAHCPPPLQSDRPGVSRPSGDRSVARRASQPRSDHGARVSAIARGVGHAPRRRSPAAASDRRRSNHRRRRRWRDRSKNGSSRSRPPSRTPARMISDLGHPDERRHQLHAAVLRHRPGCPGGPPPAWPPTTRGGSPDNRTNRAHSRRSRFRPPRRSRPPPGHRTGRWYCARERR